MKFLKKLTIILSLVTTSTMNIFTTTTSTVSVAGSSGSTTSIGITTPTTPAATPPAATPAATTTKPDIAPSPISAPAFTAPAAAATPATPAPATTPAASGTTTPAVPTSSNSSTNILTSICIQNNATQDATLTQIEILLGNQTAPLVKNNLNISIPAQKTIFNRGVTAFDIMADNSVEVFNGIQSITIGTNQIIFSTPLASANQNNPITINQNGGVWVLDASQS